MRITAADVKAILDYDPVITNLDPFIAAAEELVNELCASTGKYTNTRLVIIETWLAAHLVSIRDPQYASESIGAASVSIQRQVGLNLGLTPYGQQAMLLDTNGSLAWIDQHISQGKRAKASIKWLGSCPDPWLNYPWRFYALGTG